MSSIAIIKDKGIKSGDIRPLVDYFLDKFGYPSAKVKLKNQYKIIIDLEVF